MKLLVVAASVRKGRAGLKVAEWFTEQVKKDGRFEPELVDLKELDLSYELPETLPSMIQNGDYEDEKGFSKSAKIAEIQKHNYVLTPGRYVGITDAIDDGIPFEEKMAKLTKELKGQMEEEARLNEEIKKQLAKIGIKI